MKETVYSQIHFKLFWTKVLKEFPWLCELLNTIKVLNETVNYIENQSFKKI